MVMEKESSSEVEGEIAYCFQEKRDLRIFAGCGERAGEKGEMDDVKGRNN